MATSAGPDDNFCDYENSTPRTLVTLCARACVLYSEHLLGQLESVLFPATVSRLLVETYQDRGYCFNGMHARFIAALKDLSGKSPWTFPGDPFVFPASSTGPPDVVCLQYRGHYMRRETDHGTLLNELKQHEERISGLIFDFELRCGSDVKLSRLTKLVTPSIMCFAPSDVLVYLHLHGLRRRQELNLLCYFPNLEWLAIHLIKQPPVRSRLGRCRLYENTIELSSLFVLKKLKHLELQHFGEVRNAKDSLTEILTVMPDLEYLDISGTNLNEGDLHGLFALREMRPLKFLGLCNMLCRGRLPPNIPADVVYGDDDVRQTAALLEASEDDSLFSNLLIVSRSSESHLNYTEQLIQHWTRERKRYRFVSGLKHATSTYISKNVDLPPLVFEELFDSFFRYVLHRRFPLQFACGQDHYTILIWIVCEFHSRNPSYLGRTLAHLVAFAWNPSQLERKPPACNMHYLSKNEFESLFNVHDESSTCILDMINCQLKNVVRHLELLSSSDWDLTTASRLCFMRQVYHFVTQLFDNVNYPALEEFKLLFGRIEAWKTATLPTVPKLLQQCRNCRLENRARRFSTTGNL